MEIRLIGVVGCGQMGGGIAQAAAAAGYDVAVTDAGAELLERGLGQIRARLDAAVAKGRLPESERDDVLGRIRGVPSLDDLADCDLVVEAVIENMAEKKRVFAALDRAVKAEAILASNTSSLSITEIATSTSRPAKVAGCHFFNPVPVMPVVEIVRTINVADETIVSLQGLAARMGKTAVIARDTPGFIVNLLLIPYLLDAIRALEQGVASRDDIDNAMKLGCNLPMGPLTLSDFIGNDTVLYIADAMYDELRESRYVAAPLLRRMVTSGLYGRKSGRGFYGYEQGGRVVQSQA